MHTAPTTGGHYLNPTTYFASLTVGGVADQREVSRGWNVLFCPSVRPSIETDDALNFKRNANTQYTDFEVQ